MEFRILGPLEVVADDGTPLELGSARERALLALLILHAGEVLSVDRVIDRLWPSHAPATALKIVQIYVSHLRRALGPGRDLLQTREPGYLLRLPPGATDVARCEALVADARGAEPTVRATLLREALALWRGAPLADLTYEPFASNEIARLEEWRLSILQERIAADIELGGAGELVPELDELVRENPLLERLREQHMTALYRAGRQADALASYRELRGMLNEELGLEPQATLRALEGAILRQDPELQPRSRDERPVVAAAATANASASATSSAILVVVRGGDDTRASTDMARELAGGDPPRELLLARLVAADELGAATRELAGMRDELAAGGLDARVAAFTTLDAGADLVRLASNEPVELIIAEIDAGALDPAILTLLDGAPCDVALRVAGSPQRAGPVMVPFGAARHDWAALELGAWLSRASGSTLQLIGAVSEQPDERDASRLLADASLILQRTTGVVAEPVLSRPGMAVAEAAREAGTLVVGLAEQRPQDGLGQLRAALAAQPPARLLFVHRGARPSGVAPEHQLSSFAWSIARERIDRR